MASFSLLTGCAVAATDLPFGVAKTGSIAAGEMQSYQLQASAGDVIHIKMTKTSGNLWPGVILYGPSGTKLKDEKAGVNCEFDLTVTDGGPLTLIVHDGFNGQYTGDYLLKAQKIPGPSNAKSIGLGTLQSSSIDASGDFDTYTFTAAAGDNVHVKMTKTSGNLWPKIVVYSPTGKLVKSEYAGTSYETDLRLTESGTYTLLAEDGFNGQYTGPYTLMLVPIATGQGGAAGAASPTAPSVPTVTPRSTAAPGQPTAQVNPSQDGVTSLDTGTLPLALIGGALALVVIVAAVIVFALTRKGKKETPLAAPPIRSPEPPGEPQKGLTHDVFISYSSDDKHIADAVCARLESRKVRCWMAPRDILPGTNYAESILNAIDGALIFVMVFSSSANKSPHVMREVEHAVGRAIPIITFRIDDTTPAPQMKYYIGPIHWLDAMTPPIEKHIAKLVETVEVILEHNKKLERPIAPIEVTPPARKE